MRNSLSEAIALNDSLLWGSFLDGDFTCLLPQFLISDLALVELGGFDLSASLEGSYHTLVFPAHLMGETANSAKPSALLEAEDLEAAGDDHALLFVVGGGDALENLHAVKSLLSTAKLVWEHSTYCAPEDLAGGTEMVGSTAGLGVHALAQKFQVLQLVTVEAARDADALTTDDDHLLAL